MIRRAEKMIGGHLYGLVGGLHLMSAGRARLRKVAAVMQKGKLQVIAAGHCTGKHALAFLKKTFPQRFCAIGAGKVIRLE
jgi:7,8-dihydropterin-6-yl-methyl-4-(beta-D-ribofuranosyl)aminobenzene 5'-phosphate synthase